jgi:hypothetical protein
MRSSRLAFATTLVAAVAACGGGLRIKTERKTLDFTNSDNPPPVSPVPQPLLFTDQAPTAAPELPEALAASEFVRYADVQLGAEKFHFILCKSTDDAEHPDRLAVDRNADGKVTDDEVQTVSFPRIVTDMRGHFPDYSPSEHTVDLLRNGRNYEVKLTLYRQAARPDTWRGSWINLWYLDGTFSQGEKEYRVCIIDLDRDGDFTAENDLWLVRDTGVVERAASPFELSGWDEGHFFNGKRFVLRAVKGTELTLDVAPADGLDAEDEAKARARIQRFWAARFDKERKDFVKERKIDVTRPRSTEPIRWRWVTFAQAKKLAAENNKHVFTEVMAYGSDWSYRMDYYTYVDAEVASLLNDSFIPVKIIDRSLPTGRPLREQDLAEEYGALRKALGSAIVETGGGGSAGPSLAYSLAPRRAAYGLPAMGIWSPNGDLVHIVAGWRKPSDFVKELKAGLKATEPVR